LITDTKPDDSVAGRRTQRQAFTSWVEQTCRADPGARSALRSGLRRGLDDVPRMHRLIARWLPEQAPDHVQRAYYTLAAMIAEQPRSGHDGEGPEDDQDPPTPAPAPGDAAQTAGTTVKALRAGRYGSSLGAAFAMAVTEAPGRDREMRDSTAEARLNLLTRQSVNGLHRHLPAGVRYLRQLDVPVDWAQLLDDLIAWPVHSGRISRRWLQDYYRARARTERDKAARADQQELLEPGPPQ
jgi:CRISPR system Cascade subunit CasB